jgi:hypothetical protein
MPDEPKMRSQEVAEKIQAMRSDEVVPRIIEQMKRHHFSVDVRRAVEGNGMFVATAQHHTSSNTFTGSGATIEFALKELGRTICHASYPHPTIECDEEFEHGLRLIDRDHDLDIPMRADPDALQRACRELGRDDLIFDRDIER